MTRKNLLVCGIVAMCWYVFVNILVPMLYPGYDVVSQTVSELSAIDAPTRRIWSILLLVYTLLFGAFAVGIWFSAGTSKALKIVAAVVLFDALIGLFWPPMHQRAIIAAGASTLTDTLHLVWAFVHLILMLLMIGFGASVFGKDFRIFSGAIVIVFLVFGFLTTLESPGIEANLPTPWIGIWERINIAAYMFWIVAFVSLLLKRNRSVA